MNNKAEEFSVVLSDLKKTISSLEERVAKEESYKLVIFLVIAFCMNRGDTCTFLHVIYCGLMTRMQLTAIEKKKKQGLLVRSCKLLFWQSWKKLGRRNQLLNIR
jgi:hypothetical protein